MTCQRAMAELALSCAVGQVPSNILINVLCTDTYTQRWHNTAVSVEASTTIASIDSNLSTNNSILSKGNDNLIHNRIKKVIGRTKSSDESYEML